MLKSLMVRSGLIAFACSVSVSAYAYADSPKQISVPAGDLVSALESLSRQAEVELVYQAGQLKGLQTRGLNGTFSTQEAVQKLLEGTKLRLRTDESTGAMLIAPPAAPPSKTSARETQPHTGKTEEPGGFWNRFRLAQAETPPPASTPNEGAPPAPATSAVQGDDLAEVLVTANKREERLQSVPASMMAFTADTLAKHQILQLKDVQQFAPSLNFQSGDEARLFNFSIRGVGSESFSVGVEPSVSTIVDGVVYTRPGAAFDGLTDLERVEVLNGPQGTLQGKNASAGAVVIVTKRPNRSAFESRLEYTVAEDNDHNVSALITGPLNEKLAYRLHGYYKSADGQVVNVSNGQTVNNVEGYGFRGKLEYEPVDRLNLLLSADYTYRDSGCCGEPIRVPAPSGNVTAAFTGAAVGPDSNEVNFNTVQVGHQTNQGASVEANVKLGGDLTLTSLTAYREFEDYAIRDRDGTNAPFTGVTAQQLFEATHPGISQADARVLLDALLFNPLSFSCRGELCGESNNLEKNGTFTQEIRLTSPGGGMFDYLLGLYYYDSSVERDVTIAGVRSNIPGNVAFTGNTVTVLRPTAYVLADLATQVDTVDKAVFGNFNVRPVKGLTLTAGARYLRDTLKWEHKKATGPNGDHIGGGVGTNPAGQVAPGANLGTPMFNVVREFSDNATIGKLSAKYEFNPDIMVYGSWARGYKGEAVDADVFLTQDGYATSPVAPERSRAWEAGLRSSYLDHRCCSTSLITIRCSAVTRLHRPVRTARVPPCCVPPASSSPKGWRPR
jgi:iron complex outermembrane receptor protein